MNGHAILSRRTGIAVLGLVLVGLAAVDRWHSRRAAALESDLSARAQRDRAFQSGLAAARLSQHVAVETVTVTRVQWRTIGDAVIRDPLTHADTVHDMQLLPALIRAGDEAVEAGRRLQVASEAANAAADSVIANLRGTIDDQAKLLARPAPRLGLIASVLYDPIHETPSASIDGTIRVAGRVSVMARADQRFRPGEHPGLSVGISVRL